MVKIVELPFAYGIQIIPPGLRNPTLYRVRENAKFEIPEATDETAPMLTTWVQNDVLRRYESAKEAPVVKTRSFEGRAYVPLRVDDEPIDIATFEADVIKPADSFQVRRWQNPEADAPQWSASQFPSPPVGVGYGYRTRNRTEDVLTLPDRDGAIASVIRHGKGTRARIKSDDRDMRLAEAVRFYAESLLIVDGKVWKRDGQHEPHYQVAIHDRTVEIEVVMGTESLAYCTSFRADRRAEAIAYAKSHAETNGMPPDAVSVTPDILTVHRPNLLTRDDAVELAGQIVAGLGMIASNRTACLPEDAEQALEALQKARAVSSASSDLSWALDVLTSAEKYHEALPKDVEAWASKVIADYSVEMEATQKTGTKFAPDAERALNLVKAREVLEHRRMRLGYERWIKGEKALRPELVEAMACPEDADDIAGAFAP